MAKMISWFNVADEKHEVDPGADQAPLEQGWQVASVTFYADTETNEFALFENHLSNLKKIVLNLVMQLQLPWEEYNLAVLTDNLKLAEKVFANI